VLWFSNTGGDGGYNFHVYIDEDAPLTLQSKMTLHITFNHFAIPSGQLCICGAEYAANNPLTGSQFTPKGGLSAYSGMGDIVELASGYYRIDLSEVEWSEENWDTAQATVVPKEQLRRHQRLEVLMVLCFLCGSIALLFSVPFLISAVYDYFFQVPLNNCSTAPLQQIGLPTFLAGGLLFGSGLLLIHRHSRSIVTHLLQSISEEMPDYVLVAHKVAYEESNE
jgi:hypothetical protein